MRVLLRKDVQCSRVSIQFYDTEFALKITINMYNMKQHTSIRVKENFLLEGATFLWDTNKLPT